MSNRKYTIECPEDRRLMGLLVPTKKFKSEYVRVFQEGFLEIVLDKDLTGDDMRVLFGMISHMEYENKFTVPLGRLAEAIGMKRQNVSRSVQKLLQKRYLTKDGNQGRVNHYLIDPRITVKCRNNKYSNVTRHWDELPQTK